MAETMFDELGEPTFDGETYEPQLDQVRLSKQLDAVRYLMSDGRWHTQNQIANELEITTQSVGARLRDLRKERFGAFLVERKRLTTNGIFSYRLGAKGQVPRKIHLAEDNAELRTQLEHTTLSLHRQNHQTSDSWRKCWAEPCITTRHLLVK